VNEETVGTGITSIYFHKYVGNRPHGWEGLKRLTGFLYRKDLPRSDRNGHSRVWGDGHGDRHTDGRIAGNAVVGRVAASYHITVQRV